jgi:chromosome segregation ATPase
MVGENGQADARIDVIERRLDAVDEERGIIMHDLGELRGLFTAVRDQIRDQTTFLSRQLSEQVALVNGRLDSIEDKLDDRPSQAELEKIESALSRGIESVRAKAKIKTPLSELEVKVGKNTFKLLGFSGVTIVLTLLLLVTLGALWILTKK